MTSSLPSFYREIPLSFEKITPTSLQIQPGQSLAFVCEDLGTLIWRCETTQTYSCCWLRPSASKGGQKDPLSLTQLVLALENGLGHLGCIGVEPETLTPWIQQSFQEADPWSLLLDLMLWIEQLKGLQKHLQGCSFQRKAPFFRELPSSVTKVRSCFE